MDGGLDAQTIRLEGNIGSHTVGSRGIIVRYAGRECIGACIEEPFSGQFSSVNARFAMRGAAVFACELAGLPRSAINLSRLKLTLPGLALWILVGLTILGLVRALCASPGASGQGQCRYQTLE